MAQSVVGQLSAFGELRMWEDIRLAKARSPAYRCDRARRDMAEAGMARPGPGTSRAGPGQARPQSVSNSLQTEAGSHVLRRRLRCARSTSPPGSSTSRGALQRR